MDRLVEDCLLALLRREGLNPKAGDLEQFSEIIGLYMENLKQLHAIDLAAAEPGPVFYPERTGK